jgi:hypothetical protein
MSPAAQPASCVAPDTDACVQTKYKQSKTEASNAQNRLQKEITALRESQRSLQMELRDTEVQNDDLERQGRNQTSSLEDLESKYNVTLERTVMLDEEIKIGEQEREGLRIETQRLRDEFSDLRIEAEIVQEKLRIAEETIESHHQRKTSNLLAGESLRARSPVSETSTSATTLSSPTTASTPPRSKAESLLPDATPPSPPLSEASIAAKPVPATPMPKRKTSIALDPSATPRPGMYSSRTPRHSRGPSISTSVKPAATPSASGRATPSIRTTAPAQRGTRPSVGGKSAGGLPRSGSLYQIRNLIGNMQKLEERVHNVRSRLPAPTHTPPRASPRNASALGHHIPSTVTVRRSSKRTSQASTGSAINATGDSGVSRLSFGVSREPGSSRPSSRASVASQRPGSRSSTRTPLGHYASSSISGIEGRIPRPRSSMSGQSGSHSHSHSVSLSGAMRDDPDGLSDGSSSATPVGRRMSIDRSGIPTPSGLPRRQSAGRRTSSELAMHGMGPPPARPRKMSQVEESF